MLSMHPHPSLHLSDGSVGSRLRTYKARWMSLRHMRSSVASERGVEMELCMAFQLSVYATEWVVECQLVSQLGRVLPTKFLVRRVVMFFIVKAFWSVRSSGLLVPSWPVRV